MDELKTKVVGRRKIGLVTSLEETGRLLHTAWALRGTASLVPKGVYRFRSFEEADAWMSDMMVKTYARQRSKISRGSAPPSIEPEPGTS